MKKRAVVRPIPGKMNKTEERYADVLRDLQTKGEIHSWGFERHKLNLGNRCWYTPDFDVIDAKMRLRFIEVKGFWRDDARVKIKVAARTFPNYEFIAVQFKGGDWVVEVIKT